MAVETTATSASFIGTGVSSTYSAGFYVNSSDQVDVYVDGVLQTIGDDYVVNNVGTAAGCDIVGTFALSADVFVERVTPITQLVDTQNNETILEDVLDAEFDKLTMIAQEIDGKTQRAFLVPKGESGYVLPVASLRANMFPAFNAAGDLILSTGTGADAGLRGDLASGLVGLGSALVKFLAAGAGAVARTLLAKLRETPSVKDYGAVGDGVADDTVAVRAFMTAGGGYVPPGVYKLTSAIEIPVGASVYGPGALYRADIFSAQAVFWIAHTGKGFTFTGAAGARKVLGVATIRTQPNPGGGWVPTAHDWDFYIDGSTDVFLDDILLVNATKGIIVTNGGGRHTLRRIWGQPLSIGVQIDTSYDVTRLRDVHFWNFWSSDVNVTNYTVQNATAIYSKRNDNPTWYDIFCIFYNINLRIGTWAGGGPGTTSRMRVFGFGADACGAGLTIDGGANGAQVEIHGFYAHGHGTSITTLSLIDISGTNANVKIYGKCDLSNAHRSAISVSGAGSSVSAYDPLISVYNMANGGYQAVNVADVAFGVTLRGDIGISGGVSGAALYSTTGKIFGKIYRSYTPTFAPGGGAFGATPTINKAWYNNVDGQIEYEIDYSNTNNGTATGGHNVGIPVTSGGEFSAGHGNEVATTGSGLKVHIPNASNTCSVTTYNNAAPGGTGARIVIKGSYRL